jgi:TolA-binding protein
MTDPRITKMNYDLRLMELRMALLLPLPKPPQEIKAAKQQENMQRKIEEETEVTVSVRELDARIKNMYSAQIANLESRIDCLSKALEDLQKQLKIQDKNHNPLPW